MALNFKRIGPSIQDQTLKSATDPQIIKANLDEATMSATREAINGNQAGVVRETLLEKMLTAARNGVGGIDPTKSPRPLSQSGLECQTMALLNGIQEFAGVERVQSLNANDLRLVAQIKGRDPYSMIAIGDVLMERGELKYLGAIRNPIQTTKTLFAEKGRFLGVLQNQHWHVRTVVPIQNPTRQQFVKMLDSLGGKEEIWSQDQFLDLLLQQDPVSDNFNIYEVTNLS